MPWAQLDLDLCGLDLFSTVDEEYYPSNISSTASQIMDFIQPPVGADDDDIRKRTNLNNSLCIRQLFCEAIQSYPLPPSQTVQKKEGFNDRLSGAVK